MNFKHFIRVVLILMLTSCVNNTQLKTSDIKKNKTKYTNKGFALIYDDSLYQDKLISKKMDDRSLLVYHKTLKRNSNIKITNLKNNKTIIAKVKSNKVKFPFFFNSVISKRISEELELNNKNPYVEISLIVDNSSFVAKKSKTFDEEKNVAEKAPIDGITINDLNNSSIKKKKNKKEKFSYMIKVADFYYETSAKNMQNKINKLTSIENTQIFMLSKTKFRVVIGPFNDIVSLEDSFNEIIKLGFENIEILNNV